MEKGEIDLEFIVAYMTLNDFTIMDRGIVYGKNRANAYIKSLPVTEYLANCIFLEEAVKELRNANEAVYKEMR